MTTQGLFEDPNATYHIALLAPTSLVSGNKHSVHNNFGQFEHASTLLEGLPEHVIQNAEQYLIPYVTGNDSHFFLHFPAEGGNLPSVRACNTFLGPLNQMRRIYT